MDGMILVAATAIAFAWARTAISDRPSAPIWYKLLVMTAPLLTLGTFAMLALRLRGPRPGIRQIARQPGFAASIAAMTVLTIVAAPFLAGWIRHVAATGPALPQARIDSEAWWIGPVSYLSTFVGPAVAGTWVHLILSGRRRPERGWIDPFGRLVGAAWIAWFVAFAGLRVWNEAR